MVGLKISKISKNNTRESFFINVASTAGDFIGAS